MQGTEETPKVDLATTRTPTRTPSASAASRRKRIARAAHRAMRAVALPLILALPPLFWIIDATHRASLTTLGRDQGIFQYVGWALRHGDVDYRDVRDVNGPLTHIVHMIFLALGSADEHRFRSLDLLVTGLTFGLVGACLPGIARRGRVPLVERAAWGFAGWVILSGQHLLYLYWDLAQRETFANWFMLSSVALQLVAQRQLASAPKEKDKSLFASIKRAPLLLVVGALSAIPWFGKPTYALFTLVQVLALVLDDEICIPRAKALVVLTIGGLVGAATQIGFLLVYGDIGAFLQIYLVDVPTMYRFILPRTPQEILSLHWAAAIAAMSLGTSLVMLGLIWDRQMPRRAIAVALCPLVGIVGVLAQAKGFPYHFHPVSAALHLQWLLLVAWAWDRYRLAPRSRMFARLIPFLAGGLLTVKIAAGMDASPHIQAIWILGKAGDAESRASHDYFVYFRDRDFFPWEMRQTAAYLKEHTKPADRVQTYGMDPYVLFLAERRSATPYIYAYDLNADAALGGSWMPDGVRPNQAQAAKIRALRDAHEADMFARLQKEPPAAFVFFDKAPLISADDAFADFTEHCPPSAAWVGEHYKETAAFGEDHVWLRNDLAEGGASER
jgi:hypothetical protein